MWRGLSDPEHPQGAGLEVPLAPHGQHHQAVSGLAAPGCAARTGLVDAVACSGVGAQVVGASRAVRGGCVAQQVGRIDACEGAAGPGRPRCACAGGRRAVNVPAWRMRSACASRRGARSQCRTWARQTA